MYKREIVKQTNSFTRSGPWCLCILSSGFVSSRFRDRLSRKKAKSSRIRDGPARKLPVTLGRVGKHTLTDNGVNVVKALSMTVTYNCSDPEGVFGVPSTPFKELPTDRFVPLHDPRIPSLKATDKNLHGPRNTYSPPSVETT